MNRLLTRFFLLALFALRLPATVPSSTTWVQYTLSTNPQTLTVPFVFQNASDLLVLDTQGGPPITLTLNSDYSVTGGSGSTGTVVTKVGGANGVQAGDVVTVTRAVPLTQNTAFVNGGPLTASMIGLGLDKLTTISQELNLSGFNALRFPADEVTNGVLGNKAARASNLLGFAADGSPQMYPAASIVVSGTAISTASVAAARAISATSLVNGTPVQVAGYYAPGDGGGGMYVWNSASTAADNGGTVLQITGVATGRLLLATLNRISVRQFGAKGDGATDDSAAIQAALAAVLALNGTLDFGSSQYTYIVDDEFFVTGSMAIVADGATIKLKPASSLFLTSTGYGKYIFHVHASDVTIRGLRFDGNSSSNSIVISGTTYFRYSAGGEVHSVGCVIVGYYGAGVVPVDIYRVAITDCAFKDSSDTCVSLIQQSDLAHIRDSIVTRCSFLRGQNVQMDFSDSVNCHAYDNRHVDAYFYSFQFYYSDVGCSFHHNMVRFASSEINFSLVNPDLKSGSTSIYFGKVTLTKDVAFPHFGLEVHDNVLVGTCIYFPSGANCTSVRDNVIESSETVGIEVANTGYGNVVANNVIRNCAQAGLYLGSSIYQLMVEDNVVIGCNTSTAQYGGADIFANIWVGSDFLILKRNTAHKLSTKPTYGVRVQTPLNAPNNVFLDNNFIASGNTADILDPSKTGVGNLQRYELTKDFTADLAYDLTPDAVNGMLTVSMGAEQADFHVQADGTVTKVSGTTNTAASDTAGDLCAVKTGTHVQIINRIGGTLATRIVFTYL